jgi:hypothetical protein
MFARFLLCDMNANTSPLLTPRLKTFNRAFI